MHIRLAALIIVAATLVLLLNAPKPESDHSELVSTCQNDGTASKVIVACTALLEREDASEEARQAYYAERAVALNTYGKHEFALADANRALAINPEDSHSLVERAVSQNALGDKSGAMADIQAAANIDPNDIYVLFNKAKMHFLLGELDSAKRGYEQVLETDPDNHDAGLKYLDLLYAHFPREEYETSLAAAEIRWADQAWPHEGRVYHELLLGFDPERALQAAELSTSIKPDPTNDLFLFAMIHMKLGDENEGIKYVKRYAEESNKLPSRRRGVLGDKIGRVLHYIITGQNTEWIFRSHAYAALGKQSLARAEYQSFLDNGGRHAQKLVLDIVERDGVTVSKHARAGSAEHINQAISDHIRHLEQKMGFSTLGPQPS